MKRTTQIHSKPKKNRKYKASLAGRRFLSVALCCVMVLSLVTVGAVRLYTNAALGDEATYVPGHKKIAEVYTKKTVVDDGNGGYDVTLEAYSTEPALRVVPTDTMLVLETSDEMSTALYTRKKSNLYTYTEFEGPYNNALHNQLFDRDNPHNGSGGTSFANDYRNNRYVIDPNNENMYVYLSQTWWESTDPFTFKYPDWIPIFGGKTGSVDVDYNHYQYSIIDTQGNVYRSKVYNQALTSTAIDAIGGWLKNLLGIGNDEPIVLEWEENVFDDSLDSAEAANAISSFQVDDIYKRSGAYADNATNATLYDKYIHNGPLWIKDDNDDWLKVTITPEYENGTSGYVKYYVYRAYEPEADTQTDQAIYTVVYGNPVYGSEQSVFQGFRKYDSATHQIDWDNSLTHKSLYQSEANDVTVTRLQAMQEAAEDFILKVHKSANMNNAADDTQKIGVVKFASNWEITQFIDDSKISKLIDPLTDIKPEANAYKLIRDIYDLRATGRRRIDRGMQLAYQEIQRNSATNHNVNTICFTAGIPTSNDTFDTGYSDTAISTARQIEAFPTQANGRVYTIGLFNRADTSETYGKYFYHSGIFGQTQICDGEVNSEWGTTRLNALIDRTDVDETDAGATNRLLNYMSSNFYGSAQNLGISRFSRITSKGFHINRNYNRVNTGYYYAAHPENGETEINAAFTEIAESIVVPNSSLDGHTELRDTVTEYFTINGEVNAYTYDYAGGDSWTNRASLGEVTPQNNEISVDNFDYAANYVHDSTGKKLVIEFNVKPITGFLGGNNVPTNGYDSAIYDKDGVLIESFDFPLVNIAPNSSVTALDQKVYYSNEADLNNIFTKPEFDGVVNHFANVVYTVTDPDGNQVYSYSVPAGDTTGEISLSEAELLNLYPVLDENTTYTVTCNVTTADTQQTTASSSAQGTVYVYKPVFIVADDEKSYEEAIAGVDLTPSIAWKAVGIDDDSLPSGEAPSLSYSIADVTDGNEVTVPNYESYAFDEKSNFQVQDVTIEGHPFSIHTDVTYYVLTDDSRVPVYQYDENTMLPRKTETTTVTNDEGQTETITYYVTELVENDEITRNQPDVADDNKGFASYITYNLDETVDSNRTEGQFTVFVNKFYTLQIQKIFEGQYVIPEDVTFTVKDDDSSVGTVSFNSTDFDHLTVAPKTLEDNSTAIQLNCDKMYTIEESTMTNHSEFFQASAVLSKQSDPTNPLAISQDSNNQYKFIIASGTANNGDVLKLVVTNTDSFDYGPLTGKGETNDSNFTFIIRIALVTTAAVGIIYLVFLKRKLRIQ